jgi:hypothetical protein
VKDEMQGALGDLGKANVVSCQRPCLTDLREIFVGQKGDFRSAGPRHLPELERILPVIIAMHQPVCISQQEIEGGLIGRHHIISTFS